MVGSPPGRCRIQAVAARAGIRAGQVCAHDHHPESRTPAGGCRIGRAGRAAHRRARVNGQLATPIRPVAAQRRVLLLACGPRSAAPPSVARFPPPAYSTAAADAGISLDRAATPWPLPGKRHQRCAAGEPLAWTLNVAGSHARSRPARPRCREPAPARCGRCRHGIDVGLGRFKQRHQDTFRITPAELGWTRTESRGRPAIPARTTTSPAMTGCLPSAATTPRRGAPAARYRHSVVKKHSARVQAARFRPSASRESSTMNIRLFCGTAACLGLLALNPHAADQTLFVVEIRVARHALRPTTRR